MEHDVPIEAEQPDRQASSALPHHRKTEGGHAYRSRGSHHHGRESVRVAKLGGIDRGELEDVVIERGQARAGEAATASR